MIDFLFLYYQQFDAMKTLTPEHNSTQEVQRCFAQVSIITEVFLHHVAPSFASSATPFLDILLLYLGVDQIVRPFSSRNPEYLFRDKSG